MRVPYLEEAKEKMVSSMNAKDYASEILDELYEAGMGPQNLYESTYSMVLDLALRQVPDEQKQAVEQEVLAALTALGFDVTVIRVKAELNGDVSKNKRSDRQQARDELIKPPLLGPQLRQMLGKPVDEARAIAKNYGYRLEVLIPEVRVNSWGEEEQTGYAIIRSSYDPRKLNVGLDESGNVVSYDY